MCRPQRSESGYRLYSERDVVVIRWLKAQVDAGMAISQAVAWYENLIAEANGDGVLLPAAGAGPISTDAITTTRTLPRSDVRDFQSLTEELIDALVNYNEEAAEAVVSESFGLYTIEEVGENLFLPVLVEVGERWHRGELGVTTEHFATNYLLQRLTTILRAMPTNTGGPVIWVACAPGELHEVGAVLLSLYLRRAGYRVRYLGQNLPSDDLVDEIGRRPPDMILLSATTTKTAQELDGLTARLARMSDQPIIGYGGQIFNKHPELRERITGVFMGATADEAVTQVQKILGVRPPMREAA